MAPPPAPADRSALPLSKVARHVVIPEGIVDSLWFEVAERCEEFGDEFDAWQDGLGQVTLGLRADGMFAATIGGITFSIPRQVAKTFIVSRIVVALCTLFPDLTVLWTAHRLRTATNTFQKMKSFALRAGVRGYLKVGQNNGTAIRDANGEQEIPFANGSRILFGAREQGFGRGFDEVDVEVFDEAQILTVKALEDMVAATNQSRFEHGALLFYMGTPPRPTDPGEAFTERRNEALTAKQEAAGADFGAPVEAGDAVFIECSGDENLSVDDPRQVEIANPSYPHRTPPVAVKRLRKNLPDPDSWRREGLGIWDTATTGGDALDMAEWSTSADPTAPLGSDLLLGVDIDEARLGHIGVAWRDGELVRVMLAQGERVDTDLSFSATTARVAELALKYGAPVVLGGPAADMADDLEQQGVTVLLCSMTDFGFACGRVYDELTGHTLRHGNQPALNNAARVASWRSVGASGARAWKLQGVAGIGPLAAVTRAVHGLGENTASSGWVVSLS